MPTQRAGNRVNRVASHVPPPPPQGLGFKARVSRHRIHTQGSQEDLSLQPSHNSLLILMRSHEKKLGVRFTNNRFPAQKLGLLNKC